MAIVKPFKGLIYNQDKIEEIGNVTCPPYDVISKEEQEAYYNLSPYNIIRVELGKVFDDDDEKNNVYTRARNYLETWISEGVLVFDESPYYYLYTQEYHHEGKSYLRPGIVAAVKIEDYEAKTILPHEKTLPKAKEDRLNLLRETHTNVSQIFGFFSDSTRKARLVINEVLRNEKPLFNFTDKDSVLHSLYRIPEELETDIFEALYEAQIFIADGHHRYETALKFRDEMRRKYGEIEDAWYEYVLMTIVPVESNMLILPIHRILNLESNINEKEMVEKLGALFEVIPLPGSEHLKQEITNSKDIGVFGLVTSSNIFLLKVKPESLNLMNPETPRVLRHLDANILNELVFEKIFLIDQTNIEKNIKFTSNFREAIEEPKKYHNKIGFVLRPVPIETIREVSLQGLTMPQKTTYFYPKLWTGLVMRCNLRV
ncbi:MAG: DUF1015 domain-containing protein [Actinobacteria bacterium]|nr:DUF1015 domain-containing protein [Actinomycetota bacterium]